MWFISVLTVLGFGLQARAFPHKNVSLEGDSSELVTVFVVRFVYTVTDIRIFSNLLPFF